MSYYKLLVKRRMDYVALSFCLLCLAALAIELSVDLFKFNTDLLLMQLIVTILYYVVSRGKIEQRFKLLLLNQVIYFVMSFMVVFVFTMNIIGFINL